VKAIVGKVIAGMFGIVILCSFAQVQKAGANDLTKKWGIGLNYPGISAKYGISPKFAVELRGQFGKDIFVVGPRGYYNFNPMSRYVLYSGLEVDYVNFKGDKSSGWGVAGDAFAGLEFFVIEHLGLNVDIGPAYISLKDSDTSEKEDGVEWVINVGVNYYF